MSKKGLADAIGVTPNTIIRYEDGEIQPSDIEWKMAPVRNDAASGQVDGMLAKRDLGPGQVVTGDLLYMPLYVHKGDSVTVKATAGAVTIAATMRAKAAGKLGETIAVEHLTGEGSTMARIIAPRTLETLQVKREAQAR